MAPEVGRRSRHVDTHQLCPSLCATLDATVCLFWGMEGPYGHIVRTEEVRGAKKPSTTRQVQAAREVRPHATHQGAEGN